MVNYSVTAKVTPFVAIICLNLCHRGSYSLIVVGSRKILIFCPHFSVLFNFLAIFTCRGLS